MQAILSIINKLSHAISEWVNNLCQKIKLRISTTFEKLKDFCTSRKIKVTPQLFIFLTWPLAITFSPQGSYQVLGQEIPYQGFDTLKNPFLHDQRIHQKQQKGQILDAFKSNKHVLAQVLEIGKRCCHALEAVFTIASHTFDSLLQVFLRNDLGLEEVNFGVNENVQFESVQGLLLQRNFYAEIRIR